MRNNERRLFTNIDQFLIENGLLTDEQAADAKRVAAYHNISLIKALFNFGFIARPDYARVIQNSGYPYQPVREISFDPELRDQFDIQWLNRQLIAPLCVQNGELLVAGCDPFEVNTIDEIEQISGLPVKLVIASDLDVMWVMHKNYGIENVRRAVFELADRDRERSAMVSFTDSQLIIIALLAGITVTALFLWPVPTVVVINFLITFIFFGSVFFKFFLAIVGSTVEMNKTVTQQEIDLLIEEELPLYTIQLPVYKESEVVRSLVRRLTSLDYPRHLLDIKLLIEEDDDMTLDALRDLDIPAIFEPLVVPHHMPKTKPKACNYGLYYTSAEYLTIYDAEDIPDSDQLKKAVALFKKLPEDHVIIQCSLNYFNRSENFLTRMFTMEYSTWFDYMLPGLDKVKVPIPLGGTSNHFKYKILMELGGWDPFNVTEDADLGIRTYARGYKVGVLDSTTFEEANKAPGNWIRQRSRWIKGYMQTWLVHMRHPVELIRTIGWKGFLGFQLFIGGTFMTFLLYPILLFLFMIYLIFQPEVYNRFFPEYILGFALVNLLLGNALIIYITMMSVYKRKYFELIPYALLNPFYWLFHSVAAYKGLWQLITKPFYWEKTTHGITDFNKPKK
ncbi:MAG: glycosyltransferase [Balneolaceae bacterium]|nr:MAG: glycosyltransferase [Balneolaceae bacterium]